MQTAATSARQQGSHRSRAESLGRFRATHSGHRLHLKPLAAVIHNSGSRKSLRTLFGPALQHLFGPEFRRRFAKITSSQKPIPKNPATSVQDPKSPVTPRPKNRPPVAVTSLRADLGWGV